MFVNKISTLRGHEGAIYNLLSDGRKLWSFGGDGLVVEWPLEEDWKPIGTAIAKSEHPIFAADLQASHLYFGDFSGDFFALELDSKSMRRIQHHSSPIYALSATPDSIYIGDKNGLLSCWSAKDLKYRSGSRLSHKAIRSILTAADRIYMGDSEGRILILDPDLQIQQEWEAHQLSTFSLISSGEWLYSAGRDAKIKQWSLHHRALQKEVPAHLATVNHLAVHPSGKWLASASRDKSIRIWSLPHLTLRKVLDQKYDAHTHSVNRLLWYDPQTLLSASDDRNIIVWNIME